MILVMYAASGGDLFEAEPSLAKVLWIVIMVVMIEWFCNDT